MKESLSSESLFLSISTVLIYAFSFVSFKLFYERQRKSTLLLIINLLSAMTLSKFVNNFPSSFEFSSFGQNFLTAAMLSNLSKTFQLQKKLSNFGRDFSTSLGYFQLFWKLFSFRVSN